MDQTRNHTAVLTLFSKLIVKKIEWSDLKVTNNSCKKQIMKPLTHFLKSVLLNPGGRGSR